MNQHGQGELLGAVVKIGTTPTLIFLCKNAPVEVTLITGVPENPGNLVATIYHARDYNEISDFNVNSAALRGALTDDNSVLFQAQHAGSGIFLQPGDALGVIMAQTATATIRAYGVSADVAQFNS